MRESSRRLLRLLRRDPLDRRRPERTAASFLASLIVHALIALYLFSVATSSSEQAPESVQGAVIMTVSTRPVPSSAPVSVAKVSPPVPHAPIVPKPVAAAQPRSAPPHPQVRHELSKFAPTAPPNPTPAPVSSLAPNPVPTQAVIAVSPAPIPEQVPTSAPATTVAVSIKAPPTAAPSPRPSAAPTQAPHTPAPQPSAIAVSPMPIAAVSAAPVATPGIVSQVRIAQPKPQQHGTAATPGPKALASPGPKGVSPVKSAAAPRPVTIPATPRPAPIQLPGRHKPTLNQRLNSLIPTPGPSFTPEPVKRYGIGGSIRPTPQPEPTPPPEVIAATKFLYVENPPSQRWKESILGVAPEERYIKMYVTSVKKIGFINWCKGWVLRSPIAGSNKWIIEPNESLICGGHLEPFSAPSPLPSSGP